ncbi:MAG TPA: sensor histidine kinase, partial [Aggregatilineales bacterium]|nr:sensor histidine kinase [Aggregatilineales bacterium]
VEYIFVVNSQGQVTAHTFADRVPAELLRDPNEETDHGFAVDIATPIDNGNATLRLGLSRSRINNTVDSVTRQLIYATILMMAVGFAAAALLTWILTRPILSLVEATQAIARGNFGHRVPRWANDEIGELADAFNTMTESLAQADQEHREREQLRAQYISDVIRAQEGERKRVALELHDSTSQSLTSLLVGLRNLEGFSDEDSLKPHTEDLRKQVADTLDEVHRLAWQLRPSTLDDLGLQAAIQRHITDYQNRHQLQIDFLMHGISHERLPSEMETNIYRIVQEALTNIARHAQAKTASILIEQRDDNIRIIIEDDGIGFDPIPAVSKEDSLGLRGIQERARLFGGKMMVESVPNQGTSVFVELPTT